MRVKNKEMNAAEELIHQNQTDGRHSLRAVRPDERGEITALDAFLIRQGVKFMPATTQNKLTPEYNRSVLGLAATLIIVLSIFAVVLWNHATLSANFQNYQKSTDEKFRKQEEDLRDLKNGLDRVKEFQMKTESYKLGNLDAHGNEKGKK